VLTVVYDGNCVLCQQTRRIVRLLDWLHRVEFLNIHDWNEVSRRYPNLDFEQAMGQIHAMSNDGQMHGGYFGMRRILRELPLGFPMWMILHIPGMSWVGQKVYGFIARNRYRINIMFGAPICEDGTCKAHAG
jgi:predicted DCC family thiol-disulfide oxidoreductase YuxK